MSKETSLYARVKDYLSFKSSQGIRAILDPSGQYMIVPKICQICGAEVPKSCRAAHVRFAHPELRIKKKGWRLFN